MPAPDNPWLDEPNADPDVFALGLRSPWKGVYDARRRHWLIGDVGASDVEELNLLSAPAQNFGWPIAEGRADGNEYRNPFVQWRTSEASPSGLAFHEGSLWMASLRGARLWQVPVTADGTGRPRDWFVGDYGRLRTVVVAPNGNLWVTTSNRDGRGDPAPEDDRILEVALR